MIVRAHLMSPLLASVLFASPVASGDIFAVNFNQRVGDV